MSPHPRHQTPGAGREEGQPPPSTWPPLSTCFCFLKSLPLTPPSLAGHWFPEASWDRWTGEVGLRAWSGVSIEQLCQLLSVLSLCGLQRRCPGARREVKGRNHKCWEACVSSRSSTRRGRQACSVVMLRDQERDPPAESLVEPRLLPGCSGHGEKTLPLPSYLC